MRSDMGKEPPPVAADAAADAAFELTPPLRLKHAKLVLRQGTLHLLAADDELHWCFDRRGRILSGHRGGQHYRVGLDASVLARRGPLTDERDYARASPEQADTFYDGVADEARQTLALLDRGQLVVEDSGADVGARSEARELIVAIAARGSAVYRADARRFREVYRPVPVLPPDCYRSLVVQISEGCVFNRCSFCNLYRSVPYRVKDLAEIEQHLHAIRQLLGPALALRQHVFLGDANALSAPVSTLLGALDLVNEHLPGPRQGGVRSFVDAFSKLPEDLGPLRAAGLRRIYLGLETGHAPLLTALGKPGTPRAAVEVVRAARAANIEVGVIVLLGVGGEELAEAHERDTAETLREMQLGAKDAVFLSPLILTSDAVLPGGVLGREAMHAQQQRLRGLADEVPARFSVYSLERWLY